MFQLVNFEVGLSPSKKLFNLLQLKPFKDDEKCFLFQLKSSSCSQDISVFVLAFWSCKKQLDWKNKFNFKIYHVPTWLINNYNTHTAQYLTK